MYINKLTKSNDVRHKLHTLQHNQKIGNTIKQHSTKLRSNVITQRANDKSHALPSLVHHKGRAQSILPGYTMPPISLWPTYDDTHIHTPTRHFIIAVPAQQLVLETILSVLFCSVPSLTALPSTSIEFLCHQPLRHQLQEIKVC